MMLNLLKSNNAIHPETENRKVHPDSESCDTSCDQHPHTNMTFDICLSGHDEASTLLDWLETQLKAHIKPPFTCTRNISYPSTAYIVALSPNSWSCPNVSNALATATSAGKRIGLVHLPLNESSYLYSSDIDIADVGNVNQIRVDLGILLNTVNVEFSSIFTDCEVMSIRRESWAIDAVIKHLIETVGFGRRYQQTIGNTTTSNSKDILSDCIFEGIAYDKTTNSQLGWYQIIAQFDDSSETAVFEVDYLCQSFSSIASFQCTNMVHWSSTDNKIWQSSKNEDHTGDSTSSSSWYNDDRWKCNTKRILSHCTGTYDPLSKSMVLTNSYRNSSALQITEIAKLQKKEFKYHMCVLGVQSEISETASTFAKIIHTRAQNSRKPRIVVLPSCEEEEEMASNYSIVKHSGVIIVFVTINIWKDSFILKSLEIAHTSNIKIILISQSDPRLQGHCIVPDIMKTAPSFIQTMEVLPFYRRNYEQNALLDYIFKISSYNEAIINDTLLDICSNLGSSDPSVIEEKLFSRIDLWTETNELSLLQSGNWRYYEGIAERDGNVWGWYQIDCLYNDNRGEMVMRIHYQSRNPGSVPSYLTITDFEWNPSESSFRDPSNGSWLFGKRDEDNYNLSITNKFGDIIIHKTMPFVHHFFLSHIQREATDMCAFVVSELRNVTKIGAKTRCWFDQKASQINKEGMYAGIVHSGAYVLFLTPSIFHSTYVLFELKSAKELNKPIILLYNTDKESMGYVDINELMTKAPKEHENLLTESRACLAYATEGEECIVFMYELLRAGGYVDNMEEDRREVGEALCGRGGGNG